MPPTEAPARPFTWGDLLARALLVLLAALSIYTAYSVFLPYNSSLPEGCDAFGYLQQAEAVRDGKLFGEHTERPFLSPLVAELSRECEPGEYVWMVAPHAYHYNEFAHGVVNQYPPGTAVVLSVFPKSIRKVSYPAVVAFSLICLPLLFLRDRGWKFAACGTAALLMTSASFAMQPFVVEYRNVGSVAMTFALLVGAGWLIRSRPLLALGLASASVLFRIANVWLLPLLILPYVFAEWFTGAALPGLRELFHRSVKAGLVVLLAGVGWILLYQWLLLGSPLRFTYSQIDQAMADQSGLLANARFYFDLHTSKWFVVHLGALAVALVCLCRKGRKWLYWALLLCIWNYAFYLTHKVTIPYYPYASALVIVGMCASLLTALPKRGLRLVTGLSLITSVILLAALLKHANTPERIMTRQVEEYQRAFAQADVCWAEISTGTFEYALEKPAMRFSWGSDKSCILILRWLAKNGYTQAIQLDDNGMKENLVLSRLKKSGLTWTQTQDPAFRRILWIRPQ